MHEPQLVPALSFAPISAAVFAPAAIASQIETRPTPKQAQTTGPALTTPFGGTPRQQHAALVVGERIGREQVFHDIPVAGVMRGTDEQAGLDTIPAERCCAIDAAAEIGVFGDVAVHGWRAAMTASAKGPHCRRTDSRSRR